MRIRNIKILGGIFIVALLVGTCDNQGVQPIKDGGADKPTPIMGKADKGDDSSGDELVAMMDNINTQLAGDGAQYLAYMAEYVTDGAGEAMGNTVIAKDVGNKQLTFDFVPNDDRRVWSGPVGGGTDNIVYAVDTNPAEVSNLPAAVTEAAIDRAMGTWDSVQCSDLPITKNSLPPGIDLGISLGGGLAGDINHAGWTTLLSPPILGVTVTFGFCDPCGPGAPVWTDIDGNGKNDTAFREIYYNANYLWADDGSTNIDVESVAVHEAGHGLSQAHFGKVFISDKNGKVHFSPLAVMNAVYTGPQQELLGTDYGGHCSNWAEWPNN